MLANNIEYYMYILYIEATITHILKSGEIEKNLWINYSTIAKAAMAVFSPRSVFHGEMWCKNGYFVQNVKKEKKKNGPK